MKKKLLYWIPTALLLLPMLGSAIFYFLDNAHAVTEFEALGYPSYVIYFNAIAKIIGAVALLAPVDKIIKEWAYAGYLFILLLAMQAHFANSTDERMVVPVILVFWSLSYYQFKKR